MNEKTLKDLRYVKTEQLIRKTFRDLMTETDYAHITIKRIAQKAQINYKTFYLHYASLDDLLGKLQAEIIARNFDELENTTFPNDIEQIVRNALLFIAETDPISKKILYTEGGFPPGQSPAARAQEFFYKKYDMFPRCSHEESRIILTYFATVLHALCRQWILDGQKSSVDDTAAIITKLLVNGLNGTDLFQPPEPRLEEGRASAGLMDGERSARPGAERQPLGRRKGGA